MREKSQLDGSFVHRLVVAGMRLSDTWHLCLSVQRSRADALAVYTAGETPAVLGRSRCCYPDWTNSSTVRSISLAICLSIIGEMSLP